ncbi:putative apyrase 7 [Orobanche hederae]
MPLSPVASGHYRPFGTPHDFSGGGIELTESSLYSSSSSVAHSYSSGSLGQMQYDSGGMGSFWSPHRSKMRLQSRRSQSREDLSSSLPEAHLGKV